MKLENRVAIITGAASGIGRALATSLADRGCHLALVDRDSAGLQDTLALLPTNGKIATSHIVDLSDRESIRQLPSEILKKHKTAHLLINNAGVALAGTFEQASEEDFDWVMNINFRGTVDCTRAFLPIFRLNRSKCAIVNLSSLYGIVSPPGQTAYCASKFAIRGFSNSLRLELRNTEIQVVVVHPGGIATSIANNSRASHGCNIAEFDQQKEIANNLLKMLPSQAAELIVSGIERDKKRIIVGRDASLLSIIERLMPVNYWLIIERIISKIT